MSRVVEEGLSKIMIMDNVFYNPLARFNRSVGVVFIKAIGKIIGKQSLIISDAMAATGVRGIRYYLESGSIEKVYFNDMSKYAYKCILKNLSLNHIREVSIVNSFDLERYISLYKGILFDFVDVDPFGSVLPYLSPIFSNLKRREGFLAFTSTDLMTLCGINLEALKRKYGVSIIKTDFCHELAIRIILKNIFSIASYYDYVIYPLLATFENQYIRIYLRYRKSPSKIDFRNIGYIYMGERGYGYISIEDVEMLDITNVRLIGPMWLSRYIDLSFVSVMNEISSRLFEEPKIGSEYKLVGRYLSKILIDDTSIPYIYRLSKVCKNIKIPQPPIRNVIDKLMSLGYKAYRSFLYPDGIRTNASLDDLIKILREIKR